MLLSNKNYFGRDEREYVIEPFSLLVSHLIPLSPNSTNDIPPQYRAPFFNVLLVSPDSNTDANTLQYWVKVPQSD